MELILKLYDEIEDSFPEQIKIKKLKRNDILLKKGSVERFSYVVLSGAIRVIHSANGKDQNIRFGYAGSIISSLPSFMDNSPSLFSIEALRNTEIKCFPRALFWEALQQKDNASKILTSLLTSLSQQFIEREVDLLSVSPKERYERVLQRSPRLFQEIPALHIANYLGMTPEHLSRLRNS